MNGFARRRSQYDFSDKARAWHQPLITIFRGFLLADQNRAEGCRHARQHVFQSIWR